MHVRVCSRYFSTVILVNSMCMPNNVFVLYRRYSWWLGRKTASHWCIYFKTKQNKKNSIKNHFACTLLRNLTVQRHGILNFREILCYNLFCRLMYSLYLSYKSLQLFYDVCIYEFVFIFFLLYSTLNCYFVNLFAIVFALNHLELKQQRCLCVCVLLQYSIYRSTVYRLCVNYNRIFLMCMLITMNENK